MLPYPSPSDPFYGAYRLLKWSDEITAGPGPQGVTVVARRNGVSIYTTTLGVSRD